MRSRHVTKSDYKKPHRASKGHKRAFSRTADRTDRSNVGQGPISRGGKRL